MFLFKKSLSSRRRGSRECVKFVKRVNCLVIFILLAGFMFSACQETEEPDFILEGLWTGNGDYYIINANSAHYIMEWGQWPGMVLVCSIEKTVSFSDNAGVMIIKITYTAPDYTGYDVDKYTGIYFQEGKPSSIKIGNATGPAPDYAPIQADSLANAENLFKAGNASTHISFWGAYTK